MFNQADMFDLLNINNKSKTQYSVRPLGTVQLRTKCDASDINISGNSMRVKLKDTVISTKHDYDGSLTTSPLATNPKKLLDKETNTERNVLYGDDNLIRRIEDLNLLLQERSEMITNKNFEIKFLTESAQKREKAIENDQNQHRLSQQLLQCTEEKLQYTEEQLFRQSQLYNEKILKFQQEIQELTSNKDNDIVNLKQQYEQMLLESNEKNKSLKRQLADILENKSWQRHQQIEELMKELSNANEEASDLRAKLKNQVPCKKCDQTAAALDETKRIVCQKETSIKDLNEMCLKLNEKLKNYQNCNI